MSSRESYPLARRTLREPKLVAAGALLGAAVSACSVFRPDIATNQTQREQLIADALNDMYGVDDIQVACMPRKELGEYARRDFEGLEGSAYPGKREVALRNEHCKNLEKIQTDTLVAEDFDIDKVTVKRFNVINKYVDAVHIIAHEGAHAVEGASESEAECYAAQYMARLLVSQGMNESLSNAASVYSVDRLQVLQISYADDYQFDLDKCRPGGEQDYTGLPAEYFPN